MRPNVEDEFGSPVLLRSQFASGSITIIEKEINDIKNLQLSQDQEIIVSNAGQSMIQSSINSLTSAGGRCDGQHKLIFNSSHDNVSQLKNSDKSSMQSIKIDNNQAASSDKSDTESSYIDTDAESESDLLLQSKISPFSPKQLDVEIKDIYIDLVMMKVKCIDVNEKQLIKAREKIQIKLSNEQ
jgi:hypothetical protein